MEIIEIIKPIKLLRGPHDDTAVTGQGCFMNVIAYLNGEQQITDHSDCVCYIVRPIAIFLNDFLDNSERHLMLPYIDRALGSRTDDMAEIMRRMDLVVAFANRCSEIATFGQANNATIKLMNGIGSFTTVGGATTASMNFSNISSTASHVIPHITFGRIA